MENQLPEQTTHENAETPRSVFIKIVVTTLVTLAVGGLCIFSGLI